MSSSNYMRIISSSSMSINSILCISNQLLKLINLRLQIIICISSISNLLVN
uniref:Uncharacterized protein n=1 Tax=CrAss-like virus sp. ctRQZ5 TaxID=2826824 RepID=A0A8S5LXS6_9CAUD|nr:MAG TPA: hypothetical protein [CrAss-like virus sp. ctRQZ5]DAR21063.1 MAG TPA: hypothetical protein [Caudoviricetes sp.]DAW20019.1 MAG TPA: hypothetical protein [Caudoviricetes sp.]